MQDENKSVSANGQSQAADEPNTLQSETEVAQVQSGERSPGILKSSRDKEVSSNDQEKSVKKKKSVRFSDDTKPEAAPAPKKKDSKAKRPPKKKNKAAKKSSLTQQARKVDERLSQDEDVDMTKAIIPENEPPAEAELRQEMLQYNMSGLGAVVAELTISDDQDDLVNGDAITEVVDDEEKLSADDWVDEDDDHEDEDDEEEDEWGRSTRRIISAAYRKEMEALQKRIAAREMQNTGPGDGDGGDISPDQATTPSTQNPPLRDQESTEQMVQKRVIPEINPSSDAAAPPTPSQRAGKIIADTIIEHAPPILPDADTPVTSDHPSTDVPMRTTKPHNGLSSPATESTEDTLSPDPLDPSPLRQEIAVEYSKSVNRMIYRRGGFLAQNQDDALLGVGGSSPGGTNQSKSQGEAENGDGIGDGIGNRNENENGNETGEVRVPLHHPAAVGEIEDEDGDDGEGDGGVGAPGGRRAKKRKMSRFKAARLGL